MSRVMRECHQPEIRHEPTEWGMQLTALRRIDAATMHVRVTQSVFPQAFADSLVRDNDHHAVPYAGGRYPYLLVFHLHQFCRSDRQGGDAPAVLAVVDLPGYIPKSGRHNDWGFDPADERDRTFVGMGEALINIHDQWAVESMGAIADRTREHLGTTTRSSSPTCAC